MNVARPLARWPPRSAGQARMAVFGLPKEVLRERPPSRVTMVPMPDYLRKFVGLILLVWTIGWVSIQAL